MNKEDDSHSWLMRLKHFLNMAPQSTDDIIVLLRTARENELIDTQTLHMLEGVLQFAELKVRDIMLPKKQMTWISQSHTYAQIIDIVTHSGHSRFPVSGSHPDDIIGILHAKDLLKYPADIDDFDVYHIVRKPTIIPESKRLDLLLSEFRNTRNHMAIVVDEYGAVSGFVTLEDIIEQIIGDIEDEFDIDEEAYIKAHGANRFILKSLTPIEDFNQAFHSDFSDKNYDTIGGIVMSELGHLPKRGEQVSIRGFTFTILHADTRGIKLMECIDQRHMTDSPTHHKDNQHNE